MSSENGTQVLKTTWEDSRRSRLEGKQEVAQDFLEERESSEEIMNIHKVEITKPKCSGDSTKLFLRGLGPLSLF